MTSQTYTAGSILDLTNGIGGQTTEEILALTKEEAIIEYSKPLADGRTIIYSVSVEEEVIEEEQDLAIA